MRSAHDTVRSSLISNRVFVICVIRSVCSRNNRRNSAVSGDTSGCSAEKSSSCACISESGVRNSCAAFPVNCRWAVNPSSRRSSIRLNDLTNCLSSGGTSSVIFISVKLLGWTFSTRAVKVRRGFSACPLKKYASTPPNNVAAAVIYQLVAIKDSCAPLITIVNSRSSFSCSGSKKSGSPLSVSP